MLDFSLWKSGRTGCWKHKADIFELEMRGILKAVQHAIFSKGIRRSRLLILSNNMSCVLALVGGCSAGQRPLQ